MVLGWNGVANAFPIISVLVIQKTMGVMVHRVWFQTAKNFVFGINEEN